MNKFANFFTIYVPFQYRGLLRTSLGVLQAIFYRRNPASWNQWIIYDHGLIWRLLRDLGVLLGTALRLTIGLLVVLSVLALWLPAVLLRAAAIPLLGLLKGLWLAYKLKGQPYDR